MNEPITSLHKLVGFLLRPLAIVALVTSGLLIIRAIPNAAGDPWSATRITPILACLDGYPLYPLPGEGPVIVRMYGPVSSLVYLPTALGQSPTTATLIGSFINVALFVLPAAWFLWRATRGMQKDVFLAGIAGFLLISLQHPVLSHIATMVTVDAPAIGLATCAMAVVIGPNRGMRDALLAGLFAAMAMWSKQTFAPIVVVIVIHLVLTSSRPQAIRHVATVLGVVAVVSLLMLVLFGWRTLYFHMGTVPGSRDWQWDEATTAMVLLRAFRTILVDSLPIGPLVLAAILIQRNWRVSASPWMLPVLAAVLILPLAMFAYAQIGGFENNGAPIHYFALLAGKTALACACGSSTGPTLPTSARLPRLALIAFLIAGLVAWPVKWAFIAQTALAWQTVRQNPHEVAFQYAKSHAGEVWFPKQPLASLLAEGKLYHFDEGLYALKLAKVDVGPEWYASGLPKELRAVAYRGDKPEGPMTPPPGFDRITTTPDLPGWVIVQRTGETIPPSTQP